jgi:hypothetical protein
LVFYFDISAYFEKIIVGKTALLFLNEDEDKEPYAKFHEDKDEEPNLQMGSLISSINDDKIQKEEKQISLAKLNQQETSSLHIIPIVIQEQLDRITL